MFNMSRRLPKKPSPAHVLATSVFAALSVVAVVFGIGLAAIQSSVIGEAKEQAVDTAAKFSGGVHLTSDADHGKITTFKVEIVRDGEVLCEAPEVKISGAMSVRQFSTTKTLDCPELKDGDKIRANWASSSEVNLSYSK